MSNDELREVYTYLAPTRFSARTGIVLGRRLLAAAPTDLSEKEWAARTWLEATTRTLHERTKERLEVSPSLLLDLSRAMARAWVGARMRLEGIARCAAEEHAEAAETLLAALLPRGTRFVANNFDQSYTTSVQLLERIVEQGLEDEVMRQVHPTFLPRMRRLHARFEESFGMGDTPLSPKASALAKPIREHADAISNWSRLMAARIDPSDPASFTAFFTVMEPLRFHRSMLFSRRAPTAGEGTSEPKAFEGTPDPRPLPANGTEG